MSTTTKFEKSGTLNKPGAIGRLVRFAFGFLCLWFLTALTTEGSYLLRTQVPRHPGWWFGIAMGFYVFPYVVNIGWTRSWGRWPQWVLGVLAGLASAVSFVWYGRFWGPPLGGLLLIWLWYVYAHLGVSFLLSSILGTPGCEMRALPHLWTIVSGQKTREHFCPGFLEKIDRWELSRIQK